MPTGSLAEVTNYLDRFLRVGEVPDEPGAVNGLQVENGGTIGGFVAAVDASQATIDGVVAELGRFSAPPLIVVHHGLFWDGNVPATGRRYRRLAALIRHDIPLYSAHIPLDVHPVVGNNVLLAGALGLGELAPFDQYKGVPLGVSGVLAAPIDRAVFVAKINDILGGAATIIPGGPTEVSRVGVITGGAGGRIAGARDAGLDTFVTGEGAHHTFFDAMELGVNVVYAGHYATEQAGVRALAAHLAARFGLPWEYHDHPTGL